MTTLAQRRPRRLRPRNEGTLRHTVVGVLIVAVFLFPVYWMLNVSLQTERPAVATPWLPTHIDLHGYPRRCTIRAVTCSPAWSIALGTVAFSLVIAAPAAYALAQLRIRGAGVVLLRRSWSAR